MKITFKNVGQGDTIVFDWTANEKAYVGILDCKKVNDRNPAIEHLEETFELNPQTEIAFIMLSHPHYDHFSGMMELLNFCEEKKLPIGRFGHSMYTHQSYLDWANLDDNHTKMLSTIVQKVIALEQIGIVRKIANLTEDWGLKLNNEFQLFCIGPCDKEIRAFTKSVSLFEEVDHEKRASKAANLLSTVLFLVNNNNCIVFSSDATLEAQERIAMKCERIKNMNLIMGQVPHHGSRDNHKIEYWANWKYNKHCPAVVSAGRHEKYQHPHFSVLEDFHKKDFRIYATNRLNGVITYIKEYNPKLSLKLNMISDLIEDCCYQGDQVFEVISGDIYYRSIESTAD